MTRLETVEDFYTRQLSGSVPGLKLEIGHFNVFHFPELASCNAAPVPYNRREYYKIGLIKGENNVYFGDQTFHVRRQGLFFARPGAPYNWEPVTEEQNLYSCVFTSAFFHRFGNLAEYPVFRADGVPVMEVTDEQFNVFKSVFEEMLAVWQSDYPHKYDRMRILVFELVHQAMKIVPVTETVAAPANAAQKITTQFLELLERQFQADEAGPTLQLRSAADFAKALSIHVNYLNKALQETLSKSTSIVIQERILLEAKILLKHAGKSTSDVAYVLGFRETTHFNNFFKKHMNISPTQFRKI